MTSRSRYIRRVRSVDHERWAMLDPSDLRQAWAAAAREVDALPERYAGLVARSMAETLARDPEQPTVHVDVSDWDSPEDHASYDHL